MGHLFYILPPPPFLFYPGDGRQREDSTNVVFFLFLLLFYRIIRQKWKASIINWFLPYIVRWYNFSRLHIIVFFLPAFHAPSLSCCHWRLIPTFCNWRCSTFGQRCGGQLRGPELTFTSSIYFYCPSIYCCCNSPLIVISPPCRVFWYLKFFP